MQSSHLGWYIMPRRKPIVIFEGIMNGVGLIEVLKAGLLPYIDNIDNNVRLKLRVDH